MAHDGEERFQEILLEQVEFLRAYLKSARNSEKLGGSGSCEKLVGFYASDEERTS